MFCSLLFLNRRLMQALAAFGLSIWLITDLAYAGIDQWTTNGPPGSEHVRVVALAPTAPTMLYAVTSDKVFKSDDSGTSWTLASASLFAPPIRALAIDPADPTIVYVGTQSGVFKSSDGGMNWTAMNVGLVAPHGPNGDAAPDSIGALTIDPSNPASIYAGGTGVFKSTDGGASWTVTNAGLIRCSVDEVTYPCPVLSLAIDLTDPETLYAATDGGVFAGTNGGAHWRVLNTGLTTLSISRLAMSRTGTTLYAGSRGGGVFDVQIPLSPQRRRNDEQDPIWLRAVDCRDR